MLTIDGAIPPKQVKKHNSHAVRMYLLCVIYNHIQPYLNECAVHVIQSRKQSMLEITCIESKPLDMNRVTNTLMYYYKLHKINAL